MLLRLLAAAGFAALVVAVPTSAEAKSTGGCPPGGNWELTLVADLGIDPDLATGLASLDGNGDGYTCVMPLSGEHFIFRDNTVQATA